MNILLPLLFVLFGCENDVKPLWLSGTWKGTFKDTHTSTDPKTHFVDQPSYPAELRYKVSTNSGTVSYPTLGCTSNWVFLKMDNDTLFFEEKIVSDKNQLGCVDKMHYKLFQLSKNEIAIIGNGKTSNGSLIETNGVLAKVDYKKNTLAKSDASAQKDKLIQSNYNENASTQSEASSKIKKIIPDDKNTKIEQNSKLNYSIVGTWITHTTSNCDHYWKFYSDETCNTYLSCESRDYSSTGTWSYDGSILTWNILNGKTYAFNLTWLNSNGFKIKSEDGTIEYYSRTDRKIPAAQSKNDNKSTSRYFTCLACSGEGKVWASRAATINTWCWTPSDITDYAVSDDVLLICCPCKGTGKIFY